MAKREQESQVSDKKPVYKKKQERRTSETKEIWSDTFKLLVSCFIKRDGVAFTPDEDPDDFVEAEHVHFYRTYDSDGKPQFRSSMIGGHFHIIEIATNPDDPNGPPMIVSVSEPMVMGKKRKQGKWLLEPVPLNSYDHHTHDIEYLKSGKVSARVQNFEAQKVIAYDAQKGAPVSGVQEG